MKTNDKLPAWKSESAVERVCWGVVKEYAMPRWHGEKNEYVTYELKEPKSCEN